MGVVGVAALLGALTPVVQPSEPASAVQQTFQYTGAPQLYVVPDGVTSIVVTLRGAQGGSTSQGVGGKGAIVQATIAVTPGESLQVNVGGSGTVGGWNGGARGNTYGGGASDIRRPSTFSTVSSCAFDLGCSLTNRIVVAGGGGGSAQALVGSTSYAVNGGDSGTQALAGSFYNWMAAGIVGSITAGGQPGTSSSGGAPGNGGQVGGQTAQAGIFGAGGWSGYTADGYVGGGGGGGYYGGGGGGQSSTSVSPELTNGFAGGGAGSSFLGTGALGVSSASITGTNTGDGSVTFSVQNAIGNAAVGFQGSEQFYTVPSGVTELYVKLYGGAGGVAGDTVWGRLPVTSGQVLQVNIGGRGWGPDVPSGFTQFAGGWNGGGNTTAGGQQNGGMGGGGATDIRVCVNPSITQLCSLQDRVVVAGGGGGTYVANWGTFGGVGGALPDGTGGNATNPWGIAGTATGGGLTSVGLGYGNVSSPQLEPHANGSFGVGGSSFAAANASLRPGGGGGGGYYGGGGGLMWGGAGGSSYASVTGPGGVSVLAANGSGAAFVHAQGGSDGDGLAILTAMPQAVSSGASVTGYTAATISGSINPQFLASTPTVIYSTSQAAVENRSGSTQAIAGPNSAATLAGNTSQNVSGALTNLSAGTTYYYAVCAQSVAGYACGATQSFATPIQGAPIWVSQDSSRSARVGIAIPNYSFVATGNATITYSVSSGALPPNLSLSSAGVLSGTPNAAGTYDFTVTAQNTQGSMTSVQNTIVVADVPSAPRTPTASAGNGQATVSWSTPTSNGGSAITGYTVTSSNGMSCQTTGTSCTVTGLTPGTTYTFTVTATNAVGTSLASVAASATPTSVPVWVSQDASTTATRSTAFPAYQFVATGYPAPTYSVATGALPPNLQLDPSGALTGTPTVSGSYTFTVQAANGASITSVLNTIVVVGPPSNPRLPTAIAGIGQASIQWQAPISDGGATVTGYIVTASNGMTCQTAGLSCTISGLTPGIPYTFSVVATNQYGNSPTATTLVNTTVVGPPTAPTAGAGSSGGWQIALSWTPPSNVGGSPVTSYLVTASNGQTCSSPDLSCVVTGLTPGVSYTFTVVAINAYGASQPLTVAGSFVPVSAIDVAPPTPPATASELQLSLGVNTTTNARAGEPVLVEGAGFAPDSLVQVFVYSTPTYLGTGTVRPDGSFSFSLPLPPGIAAGQHTVVASGFDSSGGVKYAKAPIRVASDGDLASTGATTIGPIVIAAAFLGAGALVIVFVLRRRKNQS